MNEALVSLFIKFTSEITAKINHRIIKTILQQKGLCGWVSVKIYSITKNFIIILSRGNRCFCFKKVYKK